MLVTFRKSALALHLPKESPPLALFDDIAPLIFKEIFQHLGLRIQYSAISNQHSELITPIIVIWCSCRFMASVNLTGDNLFSYLVCAVHLETSCQLVVFFFDLALVVRIQKKLFTAVACFNQPSEICTRH